MGWSACKDTKLQAVSDKEKKTSVDKNKYSEHIGTVHDTICQFITMRDILFWHKPTTI